jgi:uncharacterized integral membrane protein
MKIVSWLLTAIVLLAALGFALNNTQTTTLNLWPAGVVIEAPLYLFSLGTLFAGLLLGVFIGWIGHFPHRMEARRLRKDIAKLHDKIEDMNAERADADEADAHKPKAKSFFRRIGS